MRCGCTEYLCVMMLVERGGGVGLQRCTREKS